MSSEGDRNARRASTCARSRSSDRAIERAIQTTTRSREIMDIDMDEVYVSFTYSRPTYARWTVIARASDSSEASISKTGGRQYGQHGHTPRVNTPIIVVAFRRARCARAIDVAVAVVDDSLSRVRSVDSRPRRRLWTVLCARTPMLDARGRRRRRHRRRRNPWALATIAACIPNVIIASTTGANDDGRRLIEYRTSRDG